MKRRLSVERLEDRTVPAVTSTFDAATGLLTVNVNQPFAGIGFDPHRQRIVVESDAVDYAQRKFTPDTFALSPTAVVATTAFAWISGGGVRRQDDRHESR